MMSLLMTSFGSTIHVLLPLESHGDSWRFMEIHGDSWRFMETSEDSQRPVETHGNPWRPMATSIVDEIIWIHCTCAITPAIYTIYHSLSPL